MRTTLNLSFLNRLKKIAVITAIFSSLALSSNSSATVIDFNELDPFYTKPYYCWCDNPLPNDQYLDKGLLIKNGWIEGTRPNISLLTGSYATLEFVGELPTFFSMNVTSAYGDAVILDIYGPSGFLFSYYTAGSRWPLEESTPVIPNEFVSFSSDTGIRFISIGSYYSMRLSASIDNLTFTRTSIPEPTSIILLALSLFGIMWRRDGFCGTQQGPFNN